MGFFRKTDGHRKLNLCKIRFSLLWGDGVGIITGVFDGCLGFNAVNGFLSQCESSEIDFTLKQVEIFLNPKTSILSIPSIPSGILGMDGMDKIKFRRNPSAEYVWTSPRYLS